MRQQQLRISELQKTLAKHVRSASGGDGVTGGSSLSLAEAGQSAAISNGPVDRSLSAVSLPATVGAAPSSAPATVARPTSKGVGGVGGRELG